MSSRRLEGTGHQAHMEGSVLDGGTDVSSVEMGEEAEDVGTDAGRWQD